MKENPRVFVSDGMDGLARRAGRDLLAPLRAAADCRVWPHVRPAAREDLREELAEAEGVLCLLTDVLDAELLAGCPDLRVISSISVGVDHIDLDAATSQDIVVGNTPGVLTETTADLAFALLLTAGRRVVEAGDFLRTGAWAKSRWAIDSFVGRDLHGATLGIVGLGPIGQAVARRAQGFGMRVLGWSRSGREVPGVRGVALEQLFAEADFVSLHVALTAETRGLIDARALAAMKPGVVLVNTARGGVIDQPALVEALESGQLGAVGLDVFESEPIDAEHPLLGFPNAVLTPHIGSASVETRVRMVDLAVANLLAGLRGEPLPACANPGAER